RARVARQVGRREDVNHAGAEVERTRLGLVDLAVAVEPAEPAAGQGGRAAEGDQPAGLGTAPLLGTRLAHRSPSSVTGPLSHRAAQSQGRSVTGPLSHRTAAPLK